MRRIPNRDGCPEIPVELCWHKPRAFTVDDVAAVARFPGDTGENGAWSIVISFDHTLETSRTMPGFARFLVGHAPHDRLRAGTTFEVMEGSEVMASVTIPRQPSPVSAAGAAVSLLRRAVNIFTRVFRGPSMGVATSDLQVAETWARLHVPAASTRSAPLIVFIHGGGFIACSLDTHDALCRMLAVAAGARVLALAYPLAPEAPAPAQLDTVLRACRQVAGGHVAALGAMGRLWLSGDSAGGYLALRAAADLNAEAMRVERLVLFYPLAHLEPEGWAAPFWHLPRKVAQWSLAGIRHCLGPDVYRPLTREELRLLPPTRLVYGGILDPVADHVRQLAEDLGAAGVTVAQFRHAALRHGALCTPVLYRRARQVIAEAVGPDEQVR